MSSIIPLPTIFPDVPSSDTMDDVEFDAVIGYRLSDAIRDGGKTLCQDRGWGDGIETGCALTAARKALQEKGYIQ